MFKRKKFDELGYSFDEIYWGNVPMDGTFYHSKWVFLVSFKEQNTKKILNIELSRFMKNGEPKHPFKLKRELISKFENKRTDECIKILIDYFPEAEFYIMAQLPENLAQAVEDLTSPTLAV